MCVSILKSIRHSSSQRSGKSVALSIYPTCVNVSFVIFEQPCVHLADGTTRQPDQPDGGFDARVSAAFSMWNTVWPLPRSIFSNRSPNSPTKWGMSITASGSVQRTSSRSPGARDFKALLVLSAGRGHFSPDRSNLTVAIARNVRIVGRQSIAPAC